MGTDGMDPRDARRLGDIILDCPQPAALARFWALKLGWPPPSWDAADLAHLASLGVVDHEDDPFVFIDSSDPRFPGLGFQWVPESKVGKNRVHLDVNSIDFDALLLEAAWRRESSPRRHFGEEVSAISGAVGHPAGPRMTA